jgi:transcriptional regulator with XRE-family HTH domain
MGKYETRGEAIKALRKAAGLSQEELADKLGTTKQTIYKYEAGIVTNIPSDKIELMSQIFGVSPAVIMGWDEDEAATGYYLDPEVAEMAQELFQRPEMRVLFDASRKMTKEDIAMVTALIQKMSGE